LKKWILDVQLPTVLIEVDTDRYGLEHGLTLVFDADFADLRRLGQRAIEVCFNRNWLSIMLIDSMLY
jgi:hypothetical protein